MKRKTTFNTINVIILGLATWRLSSMLANDFEQGPFSMFQKIRNSAKKLQYTNEFWKRFKLSDGLECEWCNSVWISSFFTLLWTVFGDGFLKLLLPLATSAIVIYNKYFILHLKKVEKGEENANS